MINTLAGIRCFILDMDGTFYLSERLLSGSLEFMHYLVASRRDYLFLTNNSSCSAAYYVRKLTTMGWNARPQDILTSGEATALYLAKRTPCARIFLLGTPDLAAEFSSYGFTLTADSPDYVLLGFDKTLTYEKLSQACRLIRSGVPFIATHPDFNCPSEDGFIPDCGAMIAFIRASTGVSPHIIGKPNKDVIDAVFAKKVYPPHEMAIVGDRIYTDIATGKNAGICSVLVLTGETTRDDLARAMVTPDLVFDDLGALRLALMACDRTRSTVASD